MSGEEIGWVIFAVLFWGGVIFFFILAERDRLSDFQRIRDNERIASYETELRMLWQESFALPEEEGNKERERLAKRFSCWN